ncbi:MAG: glycosyltransferase family 2 protein [Elusimicrobia bacterium]|nr:glycosyltransferase family 2 protein [Elusimicrobiota bacterium]
MNRILELSVYILAANEEEDLPGAIESARDLAHEIVVIDGGSTDRTVELAEELGCRVARRDFDNFTNQRRFALTQVQGPWVLSLDADERLTTALVREIHDLLTAIGASNPVGAYRLPFVIRFMNQTMRFGGLGRERHVRLFRKDRVTMAEGRGVHEIYQIKEGLTGDLKNPIIHRPYRDLMEYLSKAELYTSLAAQDFLRLGHNLGFRHAWAPFYEFLRCFIFRLGFLDGFAGFVWALLSGYHRLMKLTKIRRLKAVVK